MHKQIPGSDSPLISVIMPVFNAERYLRSAIQSILVQTYQNLELIIVNDGSTDRSFSLVDTISDQRIRVIHGNGHRGIASALNLGIRNARGAYIARMDADDVSLPSRFERQLHFLQNHEQIALAGSAARYICPKGSPLDKEPISFARYTPERVRRALLSQNVIPHSSIMARAHIFKRYPYDERLAWGQDYELWLRLLSDGYLFEMLPETLTEYRVHCDSVSFNLRSRLTPAKKRLIIKSHFLWFKMRGLNLGLFEIQVFTRLILDILMVCAQTVRFLTIGQLRKRYRMLRGL